MSLRQIAVVVEGQTEETFISQVLNPYLGDGVHLQPIITHTKRVASGAAFRGGGGWRGYRDRLQRLVHERQWHLVTTMIDFYAYPSDAPGHDCHGPGPHRPRSCVRVREGAMRDDIPGTWLPFVMLHEFETLIIAAGATMPSVLGDVTAPRAFTGIISAAGEAELVNDGRDTSPSKRVREIVPRYRKAQDSVDILLSCDLAAVLAACPGFAAWIRQLRADS